MTSPDLTIEREHGPHSGRYFVRMPDGSEAEMTYRRVGPDTISIDHTLVPSQFRGRHIAEKLVLAGITDARAEGQRIIPRCSYVAVQFRRHPDWSDLLAE